MRSAIWTALSFACGISAAAAQISDDVVKIGVLTDQSGVFSSLAGRGSVMAARMAIEDFGGRLPASASSCSTPIIRTRPMVKELYPNMALSNTVRIALTGAMASLAREVIEHGVTVNNILPGLMDTGALQRVITDRARRQGVSEDVIRTQMALSIPAQRLGTAEDFGPLCAFFCSCSAGYITGQNVCVDGGLVRALI